MKSIVAKSNLRTVLVVALFLIFAVRGIIALDPDLSWRIRTGFEILKKGVPRTDLYTYTMPSFPWVDHAWMTDVLISFVYSFSGKIGLGLLFSSITVSALLIAVIGQKYSKLWLNFWWRLKIEQQDIWYFGTPGFLLAAASLLPFSGVRAQVITWFFFAIFLKVIFDNRLWKRFRHWVPVLFLIWANFHGGFVAGLGVFWTIWLVRTFVSRRVDFTDLQTLLLSTLLTFINPYGWGVYREVWSSVSDNSLRFEIIEWQPAFLSFDVPSLSFVALATSFVLVYRKKFPLEQIIVFFAVLFEGVLSIRHFPLFVLTALPMTLYSMNYFYSSVRKSKVAAARFVNFYSFFWIFSFFVFVAQVAFAYKGAFYLSEENFYPSKALTFIKQNLPEGNVFSDYAWGGYLISKLPEKKVFIDGRMPSWSWDKKISGETENAMKDYLDITRGRKDYESYFEKYNIDFAVLPTKKTKGLVGTLEDLFSKRFNSLYKWFGIDKTDFSLVDELEKDGWEKVYEDKTTLVYKKTN